MNSGVSACKIELDENVTASMTVAEDKEALSQGLAELLRRAADRSSSR